MITIPGAPAVATSGKLLKFKDPAPPLPNCAPALEFN